MAILLAVGGWGWIERVSWLVVIIGLVLTVTQLRSVVNDIRAHSDLEFGFEEDVVHGENPLSPECKLAASSPKDGMRRMTLTVVFQNCGNRSARELVVNYRFPEGVMFPLDANKECAEERQEELPKVRNLRGYGVVIVVKTPYIHPRTRQMNPLIVDVPSNLERFVIEVLVMRSDREPFSGELTIIPIDQAQKQAVSEEEAGYFTSDFIYSSCH
jgi:hypothetical protein